MARRPRGPPNCVTAQSAPPWDAPEPTMGAQAPVVCRACRWPGCCDHSGNLSMFVCVFVCLSGGAQIICIAQPADRPKGKKLIRILVNSSMPPSAAGRPQADRMRPTTKCWRSTVANHYRQHQPETKAAKIKRPGTGGRWNRAEWSAAAGERRSGKLSGVRRGRGEPNRSGASCCVCSAA
jgi:hypothetical protein